MKAVVELNKQNGQVITEATSKSGVTYGKMMVSQTTLSIVNGSAKVQKRHAFITVFEADLAVFKQLCLAGQPVPFDGKVIRTESLTPQYDGQDPVINPSTDEVHMVNGAPLYRQDTWGAMSDTDVLISAEAVSVTEEVSAESEA